MKLHFGMHRLEVRSLVRSTRTGFHKWERQDTAGEVFEFVEIDHDNPWISQRRCTYLVTFNGETTHLHRKFKGKWTRNRSRFGLTRKARSIEALGMAIIRQRDGE